MNEQINRENRITIIKVDSLFIFLHSKFVGNLIYGVDLNVSKIHVISVALTFTAFLYIFLSSSGMKLDYVFGFKDFIIFLWKS